MDFAKLAAQIFNMVLRNLLHRGVKAGVNKGLDLAARRGKPDQRPASLKNDSGTAAKRARDAARIIRRLGR